MLNAKNSKTMSETNLKIAKIKDAVKMLSAVLPVEQITLVNADVLPLEQVAQVTIETIGDELQLLLEVKKRIADLPKVTDISQIEEMEEWKAVAKELVKLRTASTKKLDATKRKYMETDRQIVKIRNTVEATFEALEEEARQNGEFLKRIQDAEADAEAQRRYEAMAKFNNFTQDLKKLRAMDAEVFAAVLAKAEKDYNDAIEAERQQKEAQERAEKERQLQLRNANRLRLIEAYSAYFVGDSSAMEEEQFEKALASAKQAKSEADAIEKQKREAKDALRNERFKEIGPYTAYNRYAGDLAELDAETFSKMLADVKEAYRLDMDYRAEKIRLEAEAKAKAEAEAKAQAEKAAAEKAKAEAEAKAIADAKAKADALAKAGDGEKLKHFANALLEALKQVPETLETAQAKAEVDAISNRITAFSNYVKEKYQ